jgi:hypothetical protein
MPVGYSIARLTGGGTAMEMRMFGRTGMRFSVLGFGCGAVGGLIVRGNPAAASSRISVRTFCQWLRVSSSLPMTAV